MATAITGDGIHPNTTGNLLIQSSGAIDTNLITLGTVNSSIVTRGFGVSAGSSIPKIVRRGFVGGAATINLVVADTLHQHTTDNVVISGAYHLTVDSVLHGHFSSNVDFGVTENETPDERILNFYYDVREWNIPR